MLRKLAGALTAIFLLALAVPASATGPRVDLSIQWNHTNSPNIVYSYTVTCDPDGGTGETDWYMDIWIACDDLRQAGGDLDQMNGLLGDCAPTANGTLRTRITGTSYGQPVNRDERWPDWNCLRRAYGYLFIF
ncbi:hypothetical protein Aph01nite_50620 [Acrocarpospora phusangensis]|uniref:Subtilisin inhibitor domain-containing protein n=1 Tax=Acrocarpospora phusangensis TaxID=1070424 RepID=A0A919QD50_9ACTN|nr:hypothetical protein [Acrocarpospora phusangensis]GIH26752.1 hypothetical protein Aph01nite_50620 [Acrocarpospora phusangensis]